MLTNFPIDNSRGGIQYPYGKFIDKTREYFDRVFRNHNWIQEDAGHDMITDNQSGIRWYRMDPKLSEYVPTSGEPFLLDNTPWNHHEMWELSESGVSYVYQHTPSLNNPHNVIFHKLPNIELDKNAEIGKIYRSYYELHELNSTPEINVDPGFHTLYTLWGHKQYTNTVNLPVNYLDAYSWLENNGEEQANIDYSGYLSTDYSVSDNVSDFVGDVKSSSKIFKDSSNDFDIGWNVFSVNAVLIATISGTFVTNHENLFSTALVPLSRSCFINVSGLQNTYSIQNIFGSLDINWYANAETTSFSVTKENEGDTNDVNGAQAWFAFNIESDKGELSVGFIDTSGWSAGKPLSSANKNSLHSYYPSPYMHDDNLSLFNKVVDDIKAGNHTILGSLDYEQNLLDNSFEGNNGSTLEEGAFEGDYYRADFTADGIGDNNTSSVLSTGIPINNPINIKVPESILKNTSKNTMYIAFHPTQPELQSSTKVNRRPAFDFGEKCEFKTREYFEFATTIGGPFDSDVPGVRFRDPDNSGFLSGEAGWLWNEKMYRLF